MRTEVLIVVMLFPLVKGDCLDDMQKSMDELDQVLDKDEVVNQNLMEAIEKLEDYLESTNITKSEHLHSKNLTAYIHKAENPSGTLTFHAGDDVAYANASAVLKKTVRVVLPEELVQKIGNSTVVFCLIKSPKRFQNMFQNRLIGVSISGKNISGLKSPVNISVQVEQPENKDPKCAFYSLTTQDFAHTGCETDWDKEDGWVHCSCDHLTYFAVLMVSPKNVSKRDETILSYISLIGCSLSLLFLAITVLLYFIKWREDSDQSQQIHVSLAVALILLNLHYLAMDYAVSVYAACVYVAVLLHYSLLATFTWTAIEGFHLYLLLLRVFNIYIRRYLLKLSLVGWGFPAVVVALIFIINKKNYLSVGLSSASNTTNTTCYITNDAVKYSTTFGFFCLIFVFNLGMLVVVVWNVFCRHSVLPNQNQKRRAKDTCTVLGITCLLGISWSLSFLSFGHLATVGLYLFCVFNTLLGFFLFIWFCISKCRPSGSQTDVDTHSSSTATLGTSGQ